MSSPDYFRHVRLHHRSHHLQNHHRLILILYYSYRCFTYQILENFIVKDFSYYNIAEKIISFVILLLYHIILDSNIIMVIAKIINLLASVVASIDALSTF
jgi:hypothetical protein